MTTNEEIVLTKLNNNRFLGKNPIYFGEPKREDCWNNDEYNIAKSNFDRSIEELNSYTTVLDRVRKITKISYKTYHENGRFQCKSGARRSTCDIWRIYKHYFGDIDIFSIMRALYILVVNEDLQTYRCPDVRKRVYWRDNYWRHKNIDVEAELGVPLSKWKDIGLNETTQIS